MNGFKVFVVPFLILAALVIGGKIVYDLKLLKADIRAFRTYVMALPAPGQCRMPGDEDSSKTCYYKIHITEVKDKAKGLFKGKIAMEVYENSVTECEKAKMHLRPDYTDLPYECRSAKDHPSKDTIYGFYVDGNPALEVGKVYDLESQTGTRHLIEKGK